MNLKHTGLLLVLSVIVLCVLTNLSPGQQDPNDPGSADTLYFEAGEPCSENGDTLFIPSDTSGGDVLIYIKVWNDNSIQALGVPLVDSCGIGFLDGSKNNGGSSPICFEGSRVVDFTSLTLNLDLNPPQVLYGAVTFGSPLPPGSGLFARMVYTVPPGAAPTCIHLDSSSFPPDNKLSFVTPDAVGYVPVFQSRCFHVKAKQVTGIMEQNAEKGFEFDLKQNYPNPFNSITTIRFTVQRKQLAAEGPISVNLSIYNILGQKVRTLLDNDKLPGKYQISWDGKDESGKEVASGIYFYTLSFGASDIVKKLVLLR